MAMFDDPEMEREHQKMLDRALRSPENYDALPDCMCAECCEKGWHNSKEVKDMTTKNSMTLSEFLDAYPTPWIFVDGYVVANNGKDVPLELSAPFVCGLVNTHDFSADWRHKSDDHKAEGDVNAMFYGGETLR